MALVAYSDVRRLFDETGKLRPIHQLDDDTAAAVASVEIVSRPVPGSKDGAVEHVSKIRLWSKTEGQANLARALGLFRFRLAMDQPFGSNGPSASDRGALRQQIEHLDPEELQQLEGMCEKIARAEEARAQAPMLEHQSDVSDEG